MLDEIVEEFLVESVEGLARIEQDLVTLEKDASRADVVDRIFRHVHSIKGACGFLGFDNLESVAHASESLLSRVRAGEVEIREPVISALLATVDAIREMLDTIARTAADGGDPRVELVARLRALEHGDPAVEAAGALGTPRLGQVLLEHGVVRAAELAAALRAQEAGDPRKLGEILVARGDAEPERIDEALRLQRAAMNDVTSRTVRVNVELLDELAQLVDDLGLLRDRVLPALPRSHAERLERVTDALRVSVARMRVQSVGAVWEHLPRLVRDVARACHKEVRLEMEGHETELDKTILEALKAPVTHLVRNGCDHGLEGAEERERRGKPRVGTLRVRAYREGGQVVVEVSDDGRGIDVRELEARALERGLVSAPRAEALDEREALELAFMPGLTTARAVTHVSGRGVGMDVVRTNVERIGGTVELTSEVGLGTTVRVRVPSGVSTASPQRRVDSAFTLDDWTRVTISAVQATARGMGFQGCRVELDDEAEVFDAGASLSLTSERETLRLELTGERASLEAVARVLMATEGDRRPEWTDAVDAVSEIANVVAGAVKVEMEGRAPAMRLGLPVFAEEPRDRAAERRRLRLLLDGALLTMSVGVEAR